MDAPCHVHASAPPPPTPNPHPHLPTMSPPSLAPLSWVISLSYVCPSLCVCAPSPFVSDSFSWEIRDAYLAPLFFLDRRRRSAEQGLGVEKKKTPKKKPAAATSIHSRCTRHHLIIVKGGEKMESVCLQPNALWWRRASDSSIGWPYLTFWGEQSSLGQRGITSFWKILSWLNLKKKKQQEGERLRWSLFSVSFVTSSKTRRKKETEPSEKGLKWNEGERRTLLT